MPEGDTTSLSRFGPPGSAALVNAIVVFADLLFIGLAVLVTLQSLTALRAAAATNAQNLARTLETGLTAAFDRTDLSLHAVMDEHRRQRDAGAIDGPAMDALLARQRDRTSEILSLIVIDAGGTVRHGLPPAGPISMADREYFAALRDHPDLAFFMSKPILGKVTHGSLIALARPLAGRDGRFAGVASAAISLDLLAKQLQAVDVGRHGAIELRWEDLSPVVKGPAQAGAGAPAAIPPTVAAELASGRTEATYRTSDASEVATWSLRKLGRYPLYVMVGLAPADYLHQWRRQTVVAWLLMFGFVLITVGGAVYGRAAWRRRMGFEQLLIQRTERLRESEERFRTAFAISPDPISLTRFEDGVYVMVNDGFTRALGWAKADVLGRSSLDLGIWEDPADWERIQQELRARGCIDNLEVRGRTKDGRGLTGLLSARPIELGGEKLLLVIVRDITAWKAAETARAQLQLEVQQAQRMEAIGRLAGGVAHDFNNLLTVILSVADALRDEADALTPLAREDLEELTAAGLRARDLTRQLLAFARKQVIAPIPLDVAKELRNSEKLLRRVLGEDVTIQVELAPELWPVLCDPAQLEQIILNLAVNARDAMPDGGRLELSASNVEARLPAGAQRDPRPAGHWVRLRVRDTGCGMSPDVHAHIFEPFFTTKGIGKGTGLGLATVHGIVSQNGGHIEVKTAPGQGTTFDVYLPRTTESPLSAVPPAAPAIRSGSETVLLIEDDSLVRGVVVRALEGAGYKVLVAEGGAGAIELAARHAGPVDLAISDVVMPGISGPQVIEELRRLRPGIRVLYVSGYSDDAIARHGLLDPGVQLLSKPFTANALLDRVRMAMDA